MISTTLIAKGAEAWLYLEDWYGFQVIRKHRLPKLYRLPQIDSSIRNQRTVHEARLLSAARNAGIPTPIVFNVDLNSATIVMEFISNQRLKESLPELTTKKREKIFREIGNSVARLHQNQIAHGDLTTSNMLIHAQVGIYFIDFGLAAYTQNIEDFGTDLHLLKQALQSTHFTYWEDSYKAFKKGYVATYGKGATEIFLKVNAIESRGRYITDRIG
ncbi:MAG: KEOPS complex kinase/ATPase Bud32 [Candidatus Odinarchaeota archaeon]